MAKGAEVRRESIYLLKKTPNSQDGNKHGISLAGLALIWEIWSDPRFEARLL